MLNAKSFRELISEAGLHFGDRPFIFDDPVLGSRSYSDLLAFAKGLDAEFDVLGIPLGARVATSFHNCGLAALLFLAVIASRRMLVPLNPVSPEDDCKYMLDRAECVVIIADPEHSKAKDYGGTKRLIVEQHREYVDDMIAKGRSISSFTKVGGSGQNDVAVGEIVYTSGSTGRPKGVVLSEGNLLANAVAIASAYQFRPEDRFLTVCPLFHNSGQMFSTLCCVLVGGATVAVKSDTGMVYFWRYVEKYRPDWSFVMSALLAVLLSDKKTTIPEHARRMRGIGTGGASINGPMIASFEERFGVPVRTVYGLTETASIATCEPLDPEPRSLGSSGRPLPMCDVVIDPEVQGASGADGDGGPQRGEIIIRGPSVFHSYVGDPELTRERKRDGWLRTGDVGFFDENGNLFVVDRLDSMLIVNGEKVYPADVENLCGLLPGAAQVVLVGIEHPVWGRELILVYRPSADAAPSIKQWQRILSERVTSFKLPKRYVPLSELGINAFPTTANGKLDRRGLTAMLSAKLSAGNGQRRTGDATR